MRGSSKFCEHQSTAKTHNNDKNPRAVWSWKEKKENDLAATKHQALTGDHWTSVSNDNYLGVTAHLITDEWKFKSFTLTCMKTEELHFAEACAEQFQTVASKWAIEDKTTTRAFRGIRLCHGVVNGCLTKKKPKSFLFDLKRKETCFIQPYNG